MAGAWAFTPFQARSGEASGPTKLGDKSARVFQELDGYFHYPMTWSPDGTQLLFIVTKRRPLRQEIRVAPSDGGQATTLAQTTGRPPHAAWSPDGTQIAYNDGSCIFAITASGQDAPRRITCTPSADMTDAVRNVGPMGSLAWSPDGDKIAWVINNPDYKRIEMQIVDVATGTQTLSWAGEPDYESWPRWPAWSPKGDQIAFELNYKRRYEVWALSGFLPLLNPDMSD